jgi:hypothetical protein
MHRIHYKQMQSSYLPILKCEYLVVNVDDVLIALLVCD